MIKIIIDSTTDLPNDYINQYDIKMVPLMVNIEGMEYLDKVTISVDELYNELRLGKNCLTSQPNILDIEKALKEEVEKGNDIIFLTLSAKFSGTYQTINMIANEIKEDYPNVKMAIIDSKGGSASTGLMVIQAARLIENNYSFEVIVEVIKDLTNSCEHIFSINDLKYLIKSGRINKASAIIGNMLSVKPILHVDDGEIKLLKKVRGKNKAIMTIVDLVEERIQNFPDQIIGLMHADDLALALELKEKLTERIGKKEFIIDKIGSVLGTHLGIGGIGVFFFNKKPKYYI